ncbi:MAG: class I SAM-dependent methyltransferase [Planctomycetales bacterium]|nr:class I SAM-dependent methyltransferase [Planctomycetales bacterium]
MLDLGCGTGQLTAQIAQSGATVVGLDNSPAMANEARRLYPQLEFREADARDFDVAEPFDAVFSNAVLHRIVTQQSSQSHRTSADLYSISLGSRPKLNRARVLVGSPVSGSILKPICGRR